MLVRASEATQRERRPPPRCHHRGMRFADRHDAGVRLAAALVDAVTGPAVVLGIPRGGVLVAAPVARALAAPLDVVVPKKVGAPFNPELGLGAVAPGVRVLDLELIARLGVSEAYLDREIEREEAEIERRTAAYRVGRPPLDLQGKTAIVVDDGVATGGTAVAAARWARAQRAPTVVFAAPVGPPETAARLGPACDRVILLLSPRSFSAVGEWYDRFDQVTDDEVRAALSAVTT
jgi:putative phosphoribosyl transferase